MKKSIEVNYIVRNISNTLTVNFNNGACQMFTLDLQPLSGVIVGEREYKADRYTKKYNEALQAHLNELTTVVENENKNGVSHMVYIVNDTVIAHKFQNGKKVQTYDWSGHYPTVERMIEDVKKSWHENYTFILVLDDEMQAHGKASETVEAIQTMQGFTTDTTALSNITDTLQRYFMSFKNSFVSEIVLDSSNTLHFIFEVVEGCKSSYKVHSAYFNGTNERTTYSGLHRGIYDIERQDKAYTWLCERLEGFQARITF